MFKVDIKKLEWKIHEKGFNKLSLSKQIGIDRNTLAVYLKQPERFTIKIIIKIALTLGLSQAEIYSIFFCDVTCNNAR